MPLRAETGSPGSSAVVVVDSRQLQHRVQHLIRFSNIEM
jgi:hypothetical protein